MNVVFLSPAYPPEMQQYTRGLAEVGANVYGVGDSHPGSLPASLKQHLTDYLHVPRIMDEADVTARITEWLRGKSVDRIESNWEPLQIIAAKLRERLGVPGMSVDTVIGFRDKMIMKERVAAAGLRVPYAFRCRTQNEIREAAEKVGFPLIIKPIDGAGSADTYKVRDETELESVLERTRHVSEVSCEEFIEGEEFTFDTVSIEGKPAFMNVAQYLPKPLIARSEEWISPVIITVRDMDQPKLKAGIELGKKVLTALRMGSGFTHMEWFLKPNGEAVFGEIGCRPGGAHLVDQMNFTADVDLFREWARVACWRSFEGNTRRKYNAGIVFKRALGQGRITRITGLEEYRRRYGRYIVSEALLPIGTHRRDWKKTLLSDGHIIVRHPEWDEAFRICMAAATDITMYAGG